MRSEAARREQVVVLSALTGDGVDDLLACVGRLLRKGAPVREVSLASADGEAIAWLHAHGEVIGQRHEGLETHLQVRLTDADWARFEARQAERA